MFLIFDFTYKGFESNWPMFEPTCHVLGTARRQFSVHNKYTLHILMQIRIFMNLTAVEVRLCEAIW